ncbi:MAG: hypothetical protein JWO12_517 [Frankiales bacterium]|nr:hypothetical protein [Frankiales bacterium]
MIRTLRLLALAGSTALVLTGCGDGTVRTGAAATVGSERITTTQLEQVVSRGTASDLGKKAFETDKVGLERSALARLIERDLLTTAADSKHEEVHVDGAAIDAAYDAYVAQAQGEKQLEDAAAQAGIAKSDLRTAIGDFALRDAVADKLTADIAVPDSALKAAYQSNLAQFDQVNSAHILVASQKQAESLLAQVQADPTQFAALAAKYSSDTSNKDNGGALGFQGRGALEKPFETAIFNGKPGTFVLAHTSFGWHVIHIIEHKTTTFEQARAQLRRGLLDQQRQVALGAYLQKLTKELGVHVNPRFGTWDPVNQSVVGATTCPDSSFVAESPRPNATPTADPSASPAAC